MERSVYAKIQGVDGKRDEAVNLKWGRLQRSEGNRVRIRLMERRSEATEVMSFVFDLGGQRFEYQPGQYIFYELDALDFPD